MSRGALQSDVGEFIAARSDRLLRTAYLLTGDRERAEQLLQEALSRVWSSWSRSELSPDLSARRELVRGMDPWWRRRRAPSEADEVLVALDRLPRRQRAALVLTAVDRLSVTELADVLECAEQTAGRLTVRARAAFAVKDPGALLEAVALVDEPTSSTLTTLAQRLGHVEHRVGVRRRWHRIELVVSLVVASIAAIVIALVLAPGGGNDSTLPAPEPDFVKPPPIVVGHQLPPILHVNDVNYEYAQSATSRAGDSRLRVVVPPQKMSQAVTWVTPWTLKGFVMVRVDGDLVSRSGPGPLGDGVLLTSGQRHVVVLEATRPLPGTRLGVAVYHFPHP